MAEKRQDASDTTSTILDVTSINTAVVINKMKTAKFISDSFGIWTFHATVHQTIYSASVLNTLLKIISAIADNNYKLITK